MSNKELIHFSQSTIDALNGAVTDRHAAVARAAREAVDTDRTVTVRCFADSLRAVTIGLGMAQAVLASALKAAKEGANVEQAMAEAANERAKKARALRAKASTIKATKDKVKALASVEDTLHALAGRDKSPLLVQIEKQRAKVSALVAELKSAREQLANLEAQYLIEQKAALKTA